MSLSKFPCAPALAALRCLFVAARACSFGVFALAVALLGAMPALAQFQTPNTAGTAGGACTTGTYAWPDSNGFALKCVSSLWVSAAPSASAAGSTGYVQFNNSGALAGSANLFWNNSSGYLGINSAIPAADLDVNGGTVTTSIPSLQIKQTWNASGVTFDAPIFENITDTASHANSLIMDLQVNGTTAFAVGEGQASTASYPTLWIGSAAPTASNYFVQSDSAGGYYINGNNFTWEVGGTNSAELTNALLAVASGYAVGWANSTNVQNTIDTRLSRLSAGVLQVGTNANNANGTLLAGTVGIGTTAPQAMLQIGTAAAGAGQILAPSGSASAPTYAFIGSSSTGIFNPTTNSISMTSAGVETARFSGSTIKLFFNNTGTVGIGTASVSASNAFEVNGAVSIGYPAVYGGSAGGMIVAGNVGIGTASPTGALQVYSGTQTTAVPALNITQTWNASGTTFDAPLFENITDTASHANSLLMDLQAGGTTAFAVGESVASGTSWPTMWLGAVTPTSSNYFATTNTGNTYLNATSSLQFDFSNSNNVTAYMTGSELALASTLPLAWSGIASAAGTVDTGLSRYAADKIAVGNGTSSDYSGTLIASNVGIGTSAPTAMLAIGSTDAVTVNSSGLVKIATNPYATDTLLTSGVGTGASYGMGFDGGTFFLDNGIPIMGLSFWSGGGGYQYGAVLASDSGLVWSSNTHVSTNAASPETEISRLSAYTLMLGGLPTAGDTNTAANGITLVNALSTGNATNPDMIFQTGVKTSSGATQATPTTALTLKGESQNALFIGSVGIGTAVPGALLDVGSAGTTVGAMRLEGNTSGYVGLQASAAAGSWTMTLPTSAPSVSGYVLSATTGGVASWVAAGGSSTLGTVVTAANPSASGQPGTGFYSAGAGLVDVAIGSSQIIQWSSTGENIVSGSLSLGGVNGISYPPDFVTDASIAIGSGALAFQTAGTSIAQGSIAIGYQALGSSGLTATANSNTAIGYQALTANTTGNVNTAVGYQALTANTTGSTNAAMGSVALSGNTIGSSNVGIGKAALNTNTTGSFNVAVGVQAGNGIAATPSNSVFVGYRAAQTITTGSNNVAIGYQAGRNISTGSYNIVIDSNGATSGGITTGLNNIVIGSSLTLPTVTSSNQLDIGNLIFATGLGSGGTLSTGSVGIGTTSPQSALDVYGSLAIGTSYAGVTAAPANGAIIQGATYIGSSTYSIYSSEKFDVKNSATTGVPLAVFANGNNEGLSVYHNGSSGGVYATYFPANTVIVATDYGTGGAARPLALTTAASSTPFIIYPSGGISIGTTAQNTHTSVPLTVNGGGGGWGGFDLTNTASTTNMVGMAISGGTNNIVVGDALGDFDLFLTSGKMNFSPNNGTTDQLVINTTGVGIGTTSPQTLLQVNGQELISNPSSTNEYIYFDTTSDATGDRVGRNITSGNLELNVQNQSNIVFRANGSQYMTMSGATATAGYVGIGTASPQSVLHVNGEVQIGSSGANCTSTNAGAIRYSSGYMRVCNGASWKVIPYGSAIIVITSSTPPTGYSCGTNCFLVPADWNSSNNSIEAIGGGGGGGGGKASSGGGTGGGGGEYRKITNYSATAGASISYTIGSAGSAGAASGSGGGGGNTTWNTSSLIAVGGNGGGTWSGTAGAGGTGGTGAAAHANGGAGGTYGGNTGGGGGGAGGNVGAGAAGAAGTTAGSNGGSGGGGANNGSIGLNTGGTATGGAGGNSGGANGGSGGTGSTGTTAGGTPGSGGGGGGGGGSGGNGAGGGNGAEWNNSSAGSGGGGGSGGVTSGTAGSSGAGGLYGGGGAGGSANGATVGVGAAGAAGVIIITYTP